MEFPLTSSTQKAALAIVAGGLLAIYSWSAVHTYRVARLSASFDPAELRKAIALEPRNAVPYHTLGVIALFQDQDFKTARAQLQEATSRDPYSARYWADLALADMTLGDDQGQRYALQRALEAEPTQLEVIWESANVDLVSGNVDAALTHLRTVAEHEPRRAAAALATAWKATDDINTVLDRVTPRTAEGHVTLLQIATDKKDGHAAAAIWDRLLTFKPVPVKEALEYVNFLLGARQPASALKAWGQLAAITPALSDYSQPGNLVKNPGFEMPLLNAGLDWRFSSLPGVTETVDSTEFHNGARSLRLGFDDDAGALPDLRQIIPVTSSGPYSLTVAYKAEGFSGADFKMVVIDYDSNAVLAKLEPFHNSPAWSESSTTFSVPPNVRMLQLGFESRAVPRGTVWIDDVRLEAR